MVVSFFTGGAFCGAGLAGPVSKPWYTLTEIN
jgi:hypothetical protein